METILIIVIAVLGSIVLAFVLSNFMSRKSQGGEDKALRMMQNQLGELTRTIDAKLGESTRSMRESMHNQFSESSRLIRETTEQVSKLQETNQQVVGFAEQLQSLQDILKNPKQRGILGEYYLETVLKNVLPPGRFQMQYKFPNGDIVDAVIFLDKGKMLPIDSKFSLENYTRILNERDPIELERLEKLFKQDLKNRIDETSKYIQPEENTMDFAFMFIPSEAIFYDLLINQVGAIKSSTQDLIEYAFKQKKVIIVSPTSFMAYLQTVLQGLRALQIEESAKGIQKRVEELGRHLGAYGEYLDKMGNSLATTVSHYNNAHHAFEKVDKDVLRLTGEGMGTEVVRLDKPSETV